jgi:rubrerythrin
VQHVDVAKISTQNAAHVPMPLLKGKEMSETPSNRRRKGRNDFEPYVDPMEIQPYKEGTWAYDMNLKDWLDGWKEAEETFNAKEKEREEDEESGRCPTCGHVQDECPTCGARGHGIY